MFQFKRTLISTLFISTPGNQLTRDDITSAGRPGIRFKLQAGISLVHLFYLAAQRRGRVWVIFDVRKYWWLVAGVLKFAMHMDNDSHSICLWRSKWERASAWMPRTPNLKIPGLSNTRLSWCILVLFVECIVLWLWILLPKFNRYYFVHVVSNCDKVHNCTELSRKHIHGLWRKAKQLVHLYIILSSLFVGLLPQNICSCVVKISNFEWPMTKCDLKFQSCASSLLNHMENLKCIWNLYWLNILLHLLRIVHHLHPWPWRTLLMRKLHGDNPADKLLR